MRSSSCRLAFDNSSGEGGAADGEEEEGGIKRRTCRIALTFQVTVPSLRQVPAYHEDLVLATSFPSNMPCGVVLRFSRPQIHWAKQLLFTSYALSSANRTSALKQLCHTSHQPYIYAESNAKHVQTYRLFKTHQLVSNCIMQDRSSAVKKFLGEGGGVAYLHSSEKAAWMLMMLKELIAFPPQPR